MESLRYLIKYFFKIALTFFFMAFVWWLVSLLFPSLSFKNIIPLGKNENKEKKDILPSPRLWASFFTATSGYGYGKEYVSGPAYQHGQAYQHGGAYQPGPAYQHGAPYQAGAAYNGYRLSAASTTQYTSYGYITYTTNNEYIYYSNGEQSPQNQTQPVRSQYVRNLSVYENRPIHVGTIITGEAKSEFFVDGKFPIIILDTNNKMIGVIPAVAKTAWAVPGWVRFEAKITNSLPKTNCRLIFQQGVPGGSSLKPVMIPLNVICQ